MKSAIITGLCGQDGSWLAEQLLAKDYKVYGMIRRSSRGLDLGCSAHLEGTPNLEIVEGDLIDAPCLDHLCDLAKPDLFFNMAAQSHVGTSFAQPYYTAQVDALGVLNCLEAIRLSGIHTRFLQASTSELYGGLLPDPADETAPFHPRSPYGVAKLYGYWIVVNYRESYKMFACNSICFNHECFFAETPVIVRKNGDIDIVYVSSLVPNRKDISHDSSTYTKDYDNLDTEIWDGNNFVRLRAVSRRKLNTLENPEDQVRRVTIAPNASVQTTPNHTLVKTADCKVKARDLTEGKSLVIGSYPRAAKENKACTSARAMFLGLLVGDGYVDGHNVRLTNSNPDIQQRFVKLAQCLYSGSSHRISSYASGFGGTTTHIDISDLSQYEIGVLREAIYDKKTGHKKVPAEILNAGLAYQQDFLDGYYMADGLKRDNTAYKLKSFKTNSPLLAQGLLYLINGVHGVGYCVNSFEQNGNLYHQVNLRSLDNPHGFGKHLVKDAEMVKKVIMREETNQHVYDIETESGVVMAGIGTAIVGNSERRGPNFVTRKITQAVARIKAGKQGKLYLGNLDAKRDWGYAPDFCRGMIMMLEDSPQAKDYVLSTGETHSVREFCEAAFRHVGMNYNDFVEIDPRFYRPAEVDVLLGNSDAIKRDLGWTPQVTFTELVEKMVDYDLKLEGVEV